MNYDVLFLLVLGHLLADFPLQSEWVVNQRYGESRRERLTGNSVHAAIHFSVYSILLLNYRSRWMFLFIAALCALHFQIDLFKSWYIHNRPFAKYSIHIFLIDQLFHLFLIFYISYIISIGWIVPPTVDIISKWVKMLTIHCAMDITYSQKLILALSLLVIGLWEAGIFISMVFRYIKFKPYKYAINRGIIIEDSGMSPDISYWIGVMERLLVICAIVLGLRDIVGFALAAKSIARFKEFDDSKFVISFIMGSFISFFIAIVIGAAIVSLEIFPCFNK